MHYKHHHKNENTRRARCGRFCRNVCDLFSSNREQCFADCQACKNDTTTSPEFTNRKHYGTIYVVSADVSDNHYCGNDATEGTFDDDLCHKCGSHKCSCR